MEEKKDWKNRLGSYDSMNEAIFIIIDGETIYDIDELKDFIEQEIEKARGEVVREIYNFVESESGKSGRKEILEFISKLTTK